MGNVINLMAGGRAGISLSGLEIITPPTQTQYVPGDYFDPSGMVVEAIYSNGMTKMLDLSEYTYTPIGPLAEYDSTISITHVDAYGAIASTTLDISCYRIAVDLPSISSDIFTYTGDTISPDIFYDTALCYISSGDTSAIDAGSYVVYVDLFDTARYKWSDGQDGAISFSWSIEPAQAYLSLSSSEVQLDEWASPVSIDVQCTSGEVYAHSFDGGLIGVDVYWTGGEYTNLVVNRVGPGAGYTSITVEAAPNPNYYPAGVQTINVILY